MKWVFILAASLGFTACSDHVYFQQSEPAPTAGWERSWQPEFTFEVSDTLATYNTFVDVRHTGDYPYSNLYLFMELAHGNEVLSRDTVECPLAAPDGTWYGKGLGFIHEDRFQAHVLFRYNKRFPRTGTYTLTLEQAMRREVLEGVVDVGITIEIVDR